MSAVSLVQRRRTELENKIDSLSAELTDWKARTDVPPLRRHYRQVRRLAATLGGLLQPLADQFKNGPVSDNDLLANSANWENEILTAHTIWEVFRSKLVLRQVELFRDYLAACDDFAFACYQSARDHFTDNPKEPPLVYLSATWSPFAMARDGNFQNEIRAARGTAGFLVQPEFQEVLNNLPIPLLSIPWYQVSLLPCALILAHEVGHIVEWDFGLTEDISAALKLAGLEHESVWLGWAAEAFADVFGCLSSGPAFVGALMDLLSSSRDAIQQEEKESGRYPTRYLRIELCLEVLEKINRSADAKRLRADWVSAYGPMTRMTQYLEDLKKVAAALIAGPYRQQRMDVIVTPPADDPSVPAQTALAGLDLNGTYADARSVFAAARWLHENHTHPGEVRSACLRLRDHLVRSTGEVFRAEPDEEKEKIEKAQLAEQVLKDHQLGLALRKQLNLS